MTKQTVSCLHHADPHFLQVRVDFLAICDGNEAQAKILRILEAWTDFKISRGESRWVSMSCRQFIEQSYSTLGESTIYKALKTLMEREYIKRRRHPKDPCGTPEYRLNLPGIQQALDNYMHTTVLAKSHLEEVEDEAEILEDGASERALRNDGTSSQEKRNEREENRESTEGNHESTDIQRTQIIKQRILLILLRRRASPRRRRL